jgi:hypothetical protein
MEWGDTTGAYRNLPNNAKRVLLHPLRYVNDPAGFLQTPPTCHRVGGCIYGRNARIKEVPTRNRVKQPFDVLVNGLQYGVSRSENMSNLVISGYPKA